MRGITNKIDKLYGDLEGHKQEQGVGMCSKAEAD